MDSFQTQEEIQRILSTILPEIGKQIAQKYRQNTLQKRAAAYEMEERKLQQQAHQEYLQLSNVIKGEHDKAISKQRQQFQKQLYEISMMSTQRQRIQQIKYQQFKQRMKQTNIQQLIIQSDLVLSLQQEISDNLEHKFKLKLEQDLLNYTKQMTYKSSRRLKNQLDAEKKEIDHRIESIGVSLKKEVESQKTALATLRSKSNIIIKKLSAEKQEYIKKYQVQSAQKQQLYQQLLMRYKELEKEAIQQAGVHLKNSLNDYPYSYKQQNNPNALFQLISQQSQDKEISESYEQQSHPSVYETHFETVKIPYSRILDMDIRKYTSTDTQSQNKSINQISSYLSKGQKQEQKESKFKQQYNKELSKLNKKNKLSAVAKSLIVDTIIRKGKECEFKFVNLR